MRSDSSDLYEVLEVPPRADRATVARAWRLKRDRVEALLGDRGAAQTEALCAKLDEAFAILSNPRSEARYRAYRQGDRLDAATPDSLYRGLEFDAAGDTRRGGPDTSERYDVLESLLEPPDPEMPPWGTSAGATPFVSPEPARDPDLATPSTEWDLDDSPGAEPSARSAIRPTLQVASAQRILAAEQRRVATDRLLRAVVTPPWQ